MTLLSNLSHTIAGSFSLYAFYYCSMLTAFFRPTATKELHRSVERQPTAGVSAGYLDLIKRRMRNLYATEPVLPNPSFFEKLQIVLKLKNPPPPPPKVSGFENLLDYLGDDWSEQMLLAAWILIIFVMIGYIYYLCWRTPVVDKSEQDTHETTVNVSPNKDKEDKEEKMNIPEEEVNHYQEMLDFLDKIVYTITTGQNALPTVPPGESLYTGHRQRLRKSGEKQLASNRATLAAMNAKYKIAEDRYDAAEERMERFSSNHQATQ